MSSKNMKLSSPYAGAAALPLGLTSRLGNRGTGLITGDGDRKQMNATILQEKNKVQNIKRLFFVFLKTPYKFPFGVAVARFCCVVPA